MDLSSVLPLLMNSGNGGNTDAGRLASVLSAMNGGKSENTDTASMINMLSAMKNGGDNGGGNPLNSNILSLLSLANKNNRPKKPSGLKPIKNIAPNDILGVLVKYLTESL